MKRQTTQLKPGLAPIVMRLAAAALALSGALGYSQPALAQESEPVIVITDVDSREFPTVNAGVRVTGRNGLPLVGLSANDFTVQEDGQTVPASALQLESDTSQHLSLVLAIDISTANTDLASLQAAATEFVAALGPNDQVALLAFHDTVDAAQPFTSSQEDLASAIAGLSATGSATVFNAAADQAVSLLAALPAGGRKAVIMLTNSGETANTVSPEPILASAQAAQVSIYPIGFGPNINEELLNNWARFSGGQAYRLATSNEVGPNLLTLGVLLRQSYRIVFTSGLQADNARHSLTISLDAHGQTGEAETQFTAVPRPVTVGGPGVTNGQTVRGMVFLVADVEAPAPVVSVTFLLDGAPLVELTRPPYRFDWDTTGLGAGVRTLTIRAVDTAGNSGETQVSVNVVQPPPVVITATPSPTATPVVNTGAVMNVAQNALRIGQHVLIIGLLLVGLLIALALLGRARRGLRTGQVRSCAIEINNSGNQRSRYELRAEDPSGALKFQFMLNDASLAQNVAVAPAPVPARPAKAAPPAPGSTAGAAPPPGRFKDAEQKLGQAQGAAAGVGGWLMELGRLLPGSAGRSARSASAQIGNAQHGMHEIAEQPGRTQRAVGRVVPIKTVAPRPSEVTQISAPAPALTAPAPPAPGSTAGAAPAAPARKAAAGWSLTPFVEPGANLRVELRVSPARTPRTQHYPFRVLSRTAEEQDAPAAIEHGSVALAGVPWLRRLMPPVLFLAAAALAAGLVWYLLTIFGVLA